MKKSNTLRRRGLALFLALVMCVSLLPGTALAEGNGTDTITAPVASLTGDNVPQIFKTVSYNPNTGTYTVTMDAYVTGTVVPPASKPADIVLVLDQSGSMGDNFTQGTRTRNPVYESDLKKDKSYALSTDADEASVSWCNECNAWTVGCYYDWHYPWPHHPGTKYAPTTSDNDTDPNHTQFYGRPQWTPGVTKVSALQTAVNTFLTSVETSAKGVDGQAGTPDDIPHRVAVVGFADTYSRGYDSYRNTVLFDGASTTTFGNLTGSNYAGAFKDVSTPAGAQTVRDSISHLQTNGGTYVNHGLAMANNIFDNDPQKDTAGDRNRVVIVFTDGIPGTGTWSDNATKTCANNALTEANTAKTTYNASVFTVGIFQGADQTSAGDQNGNNNAKSNWFMQSLSSNNGQVKTGDSYYLSANNADGLNNIFKAISSSVINPDVNMGSSAVLYDIMSPAFTLPDNMTASNVTVQEIPAKDDNGKIGFDETNAKALPLKTDTQEGVIVTVDKATKTVKVSGFDYTANAVTNNNGTVTGSKLRISFQIIPDITYPSWGANTNTYGANYPTNAAAGFEGTDFTVRENPTGGLQLPVKTHTVTYNANTDALTDKTLYASKTAATSVAAPAEISVLGTTTGDVTNPNYYINGQPFGAAATAFEGGYPTVLYTRSTPDIDGDSYVNGKFALVHYEGEGDARHPVAGWDISSNSGKTMGTADVTYTGVWLDVTNYPVNKEKPDDPLSGLPKYQVRYQPTIAAGAPTDGRPAEVNDTTIVPDPDAEYFVGQKVIVGALLSTATASPWTFSGWTYNSTTYAAGNKVAMPENPTDGFLTFSGVWNYANLSVVKTVTDKTGGYKAGDTITWTITVTNNGTQPVSGLSLSENLTKAPVAPGTEPTPVDPSDITSSPSVNKASFDLAAGGSVTFTVTLDNAGAGTYNNTAVVTKDGTPQGNSEQVTVTVDPRTYDYSLSYDANGGSGEPSMDSVTDRSEESWSTNVSTVVPTLTDYAFMGWAETADARVGTYKGGESITLTSAAPAKTLYAVWEPVQVNHDSDILVDKTTTATFVNVGDTVTWTIRVTNNGTTDRAVTLKDLLDSNGVNQILTSVTPASPVNLAPGTSTDFTVTYLVVGWDAGHTLVNRVYVYDDTTPDAPAIGTATAPDVHVNDVPRYTLTVNYQFADGTQAAMPYIRGGYAVEDSYIVDSPAIAGYTADRTVVTGSMVEGGVTETVTYTANPIPTHSVIWRNWDGTELYRQNGVANGTTLPSSAYAGTPTRPADAAYTYTFTGWAGPFTEGGNDVYTAQYTPTAIPPRTHTVTWVNWDGTVLQRELDVPAGTTPSYTGATPVRPADAAYTYAFSTWSAPETDADGNVTYTAQYTPTAIPTGPVTPINPVTPVTPNPGTNIPDTPTPLGPTPGTNIEDEDVPLAAPGLNSVDHFDYVKGYGDGLVKPEANITRAEVATIFFRLMTNEFRTENWATENTFTDVKAGDWYNNAISTAAKAGILNGYADSSFQPNKDITRAEFAAIAARFASDVVPSGGMFSDIEGHWAQESIERASAAGWIRGSDGKFRPEDKITRAEAITLINRMLDRVPDADHMLPDMITFTDNTPDKWYYADVQEAANSHDYDRDEIGVTEIWTAILPAQDWTALEKEWATAASAPAASVAPSESGDGTAPEAGGEDTTGSGEN